MKYVFLVGNGPCMSTMQLKYPADMMKTKLINSLRRVAINIIIRIPWHHCL